MAILLGFFVAFAIGLVGIGGGVITAPVLLLAGLAPAEAVGTALAFSALVKLPAAFVHWREGHVNARALRRLLLGGVPGVLVGALLLRSLGGGGAEETVLALVGLTVFATATIGLVFALHGRPPARRCPEWGCRVLTPIAFLVGAEVGFSSAGAGALGNLALLSFSRLSTAEVVGTDLAFGLVLALFGGSIYAGMGGLNPGLLFQLALGGILGAFLGAKALGHIPERPMRLGLLTWLSLLGLGLFIRGLGGGVHG